MSGVSDMAAVAASAGAPLPVEVTGRMVGLHSMASASQSRSWAGSRSARLCVIRSSAVSMRLVRVRVRVRVRVS